MKRDESADDSRVCVGSMLGFGSFLLSFVEFCWVVFVLGCVLRLKRFETCATYERKTIVLK
jgi:hypothetical protein